MNYELSLKQLIHYEEEIHFHSMDIVIHISRSLTSDEEAYIIRLIDGWFLVGMHYGYEGNKLSYRSDIVFEDEQSIYLNVDFGGENVTALNILLESIYDALKMYEVTIEKIELE